MLDSKVVIMKKNCIFFVLLLVLLIVSSRIFTQISKTSQSVNLGTYWELAGLQKEKENTVDVLVMGDSLCFTTVSPMVLWRETGTTSYILGHPGQKITEAYYILKEALKTQSPKLLLMETNLLYWEQSIMDKSKTALGEMYMNLFPVFRYHNLWKDWLSPEGTGHGEEFMGFQIRDKVNPYTGGDYMHETEAVQQISNVEKWYFSRMLEICKENNIQVLLYSSPSPKNYNYSKHNAIKAYADANQIAYVDFNLSIDEAGINWETDSLDNGDHLNVFGAEKASRYLADYIEANYHLPDYRNDNDYREWEMMSLKYKEMIEGKTTDTEKSGG